MAKNTITKRDALNAILAKVQDTPALVAYCNHELELLDKKSAKSAEKSAEKSATYATMRETIADILTGAENGMTVTDILANGTFVDADGKPVTNQKLTYVLNTTEGKAMFTKATVKGKTYYSLV